MNRREFVISTVGYAIALSAPARIAGQKRTIEPDLATLSDGKGLKVFNRTASSLTDGARKGLHLSEASGDGGA